MKISCDKCGHQIDVEKSRDKKDEEEASKGCALILLIVAPLVAATWISLGPVCGLVSIPLSIAFAGILDKAKIV